jgi:actin-related protein
VYDASARSLKRLRVALTIDLRLSAKRKSRVDAQRRASFEIALDSKSEMKKKKKKIATKKVVKEEKKKEEKRKKRKNDADDDDEKNDDVDVRIVQIVVNKQFEVQIFVIIDKRSFSRRFVKK